jgi:hypothetical protein
MIKRKRCWTRIIRDALRGLARRYPLQRLESSDSLANFSFCRLKPGCWQPHPATCRQQALNAVHGRRVGTCLDCAGALNPNMAHLSAPDEGSVRTSGENLRLFTDRITIKLNPGSRPAWLKITICLPSVRSARLRCVQNDTWKYLPVVIWICSLCMVKIHAQDRSRWQSDCTG